jgi:hypothetical protein
MEINQILNKYLSKERLSDIICKYQLYYQIGLGNVALESLQDLQETVDKINQLNLQVRSEVIIDSLSHIIYLHKNNRNFDLDFEYYLRYTALTHMLDDFIKADKDLIHPEPFRDMMYEQIEEDVFFTKTMQQQFELDYQAILPSIKATITESIANDVKKIIVEMINTNSIS